MFDRVFEGATVVDGTGAEPFTADVAVQDGRIAEVFLTLVPHDPLHMAVMGDRALAQQAATHVFMGFPGYREIAALPLAARAAALRDPARKARILSERSERLAGDGSAVPPIVDILLSRIEQVAWRMFPLTSADGQPDDEPPFSASLGVRALELLYDHFAEGDGSNLVCFPIFNYNDGRRDVVRQMMDHPRMLYGLSDAGAHVGTICDASSSAFLLAHWVRDRPQGRLPLATAVQVDGEVTEARPGRLVRAGR